MKALTVAVLVLLGLPTAQAADPETLTCQGTVADEQADATPKPISMGMIVNLTARTVAGFTRPGNDGVKDFSIFAPFPITIDFANETNVLFSGSNNFQSISGTIDRVTGDVEATWSWGARPGEIASKLRYILKCRPAQRMF